MLRIHEIKRNPGQAMDCLPKIIEKKLDLKEGSIVKWTLIKESVDARKKPEIKLVDTVDFIAEGTEEWILTRGLAKKLKIAKAPEYAYLPPKGKPEGQNHKKRKNPPVVVGFGPCGMFCALILAQMGYCPIVLERGKAMEERAKDVEKFWRDGILNSESNVQFGEGGAGTFSDGKLTTQIKDPRIRKVLEEMVQAGGGEELLYQQKPHVGTDVLRKVVTNIREEILRFGGQVRFQQKVTGLILNAEGTAISALEINEKESILAQTVVFAIGHSARDTFRSLNKQGIHMEQKPFSIGVRMEHPQEMIDLSQYGKPAAEIGIGAADYKLSYRCQNGRGVYTFCMCPGGRVIASASEEGGLVTNGMSYRKRDLENANSGLLVDVRTEDFNSNHPLAGMDFQEIYERLAFQIGGGNYRAPAQRTEDFLKDRETTEEKGCSNTIRPSYEPGVTWTSVAKCLPEFATAALKEALPQLGRKLKGFDCPDGVLTGIESRSSSPVRILRNEELQSNIAGIYPGGEGAGYAGGITSAAVDGIRIAEKIAENDAID